VAEAINEPAILCLYSTQDQLEALSNTLDLVPPEQEEELVALIGQTLSAYTEKRDRLSRFLAISTPTFDTSIKKGQHTE
jgi:hypothetical protein